MLCPDWGAGGNHWLSGRWRDSADGGLAEKSPIYSVQREDKVVSLTFDTAWGNGQTEDLLNILDQYQVKSTFFVTGQWAQEHPEMVKAMSERGHDVCNYSDTHPHMPQISREQQSAEITGCNEKSKGKSPA